MRYQSVFLFPCVFLLFCGKLFASYNIDFLGKITDSTCNVSISGDSKNTVILPRIFNSQLPEIGSTAGFTVFIINATDCSVHQGDSSVSVFFSAGGEDGSDINNVDNSTGYLNNLAENSPASDIKLRLSDTALGDYIKVGFDSQIEHNKYKAFINQGSEGNLTYLPYIVEYIKTANTGHDVGAVRGEVVYNLMYK